MTALPDSPCVCDMAKELEEIAAGIRTRYRWLILELQIELVEGGMVLRGRAVTFYGKQVAQYELLRRGLAIVANHIAVTVGKRL